MSHDFQDAHKSRVNDTCVIIMVDGPKAPGELHPQRKNRVLGHEALLLDVRVCETVDRSRGGVAGLGLSCP